MIFRVELCDHCGVETKGKSFEAYRLEGHDRVLHICDSCQRKPFKRVVEKHPRVAAVENVLQLVLRSP